MAPLQFLIIAGPNGSGKSTSAPAVLPGPIPYVNADDIARGLPEDPARNKDLRAGRILLEELDRHAPPCHGLPVPSAVFLGHQR